MVPRPPSEKRLLVSERSKKHFRIRHFEKIEIASCRRFFLHVYSV